jgi:hypothetical protein
MTIIHGIDLDGPTMRTIGRMPRRHHLEITNAIPARQLIAELREREIRQRVAERVGPPPGETSASRAVERYVGQRRAPRRSLLARLYAATREVLRQLFNMLTGPTGVLMLLIIGAALAGGDPSTATNSEVWS